MPLFGECKNISQTASLGETYFSLIACLHVCLYFFTTFCEKDRERRERERRITLVEEEDICLPRWRRRAVVVLFLRLLCGR